MARPTCSTLRRVEPNATNIASIIGLVLGSCSTLRRVEPNATLTLLLAADNANRLAVPSDGSNLMQLAHLFDALLQIVLAVPSDGSNLMQRTNPTNWPPAAN